MEIPTGGHLDICHLNKPKAHFKVIYVIMEPALCVYNNVVAIFVHNVSTVLFI